MASNNFINECKNYAYENRYGKLILGEPTTAEIGSNVSITDARASRLLEDKMSKLSTQETTTGKNIFNKNAVRSNSSSVSVTVLDTGVKIEQNTVATYRYASVTVGASELLGKSVTITANISKSGSNSALLRLWFGSASNVAISQIGGTLSATGSQTISIPNTFPTNADRVWLLLYSNSAGTSEIGSYVNYTNLQVEVGTSSTSYEPYTNGPSPNPDYPQEVNTVKGYRNLFDNTMSWSGTSAGKVNYNSIDDIFTFHRDSGSDYLLNYGKLSLKPDTEYKLYFDVKENTMTQEFKRVTSSSYFTSGSFSIPAGQTGIFSATLKTGTSSATYDLWLYCNSTGTLKAKVMLTETNQVKPYIPYGTNWIYKKIIGKNLLKPNFQTKTTRGITASYTQNGWSLNGDLTSYNTTDFTIFEEILLPGTYTINGLAGASGSSYQLRVYENEISKTYIKTTDYTFTINEPTSIKIVLYCYRDYGTFNNLLLPYQLEQGTTATTYKPYQESIITIPLNDNEICGIGNYKDELIIDKNGHCWLNKKIGKTILTDAASILAGTIFGVQCQYVNFSLTDAINVGRNYNFFNNKIAKANEEYHKYAGYRNARNFTVITDTNDTLDNFNSNISGSVLYYVLAESNLIDLNQTVDLTLFEGTNNISNSEDMDMEIIYKASVELNQSNKIQEFTIDSGCYDNGNVIGSVYVTKLNAQLINALDNTLENVDCDASVGVKYDNDTTEYVNLGSYVVEKPKDEQTTNFSSFVAYDLLMNHLEEKYSTSLDYDNETITIADVYDELCTNLGLTPVTTTFTNSTITVDNNPFSNGETNRTVLQSICKVACAFVDIDYDNNNIDLKWLSNTLDYTFQKSDYSTVEGGKTVYGPVNSLIIKNSVIDSENVSHSDSASILQNGEHQLVISEDYFLYNQEKRTEALTNIWNKVNGLTYTECTLNTQTGKPFLKVGSKIRIYTDTNEYFDSYVLQNEFKYNGYFSNVIKCPVLTEQEVQTKQTVDLGYKVKQAEIIIDKQSGIIEEITGQINDENKAIDGIRTTQTATERRIDVISSNIDENGNITEVTTITGFTFNASGLHISGDGFEANHTSQGTYYKDGDAIVGQYTKDGSKQKDLELFGTYSYGKNDINDEPMFIAQLYTDENGEEGFGHFSNVE